MPAKLAGVFKVGAIHEMIFRSQKNGKLYKHIFKGKPAILASGQARGVLILKGNIGVERSTLEIRG